MQVVVGAFTVQLLGAAAVAVALVVQDCPPGDAVARYPMIGKPGVPAEAVQPTVAEALPATAKTLVGALGPPGGIGWTRKTYPT